MSDAASIAVDRVSVTFRLGASRIRLVGLGFLHVYGTIAGRLVQLGLKPEASHGLFPTGAASVLLPERAGAVVANQVLWLGARLNAQQMVAHGLAHAAVPPDRLAQEAEELARRLLALPAVSRRRLKQARANDLRERLERALTFETRCCLDAAVDPQVRARAAARA